MSFSRGGQESQRTKNNNSDGSHNNSQHVLAIVAYRKPHSQNSNNAVLQDFSKTSATALPIEIWRHDYETNHNGNNDASSSYVILSSNYPNCILESEHFCVLSAGFPYHYQAAFGEFEKDNDDDEASSKANTDTTSNRKSFSRTVLDYCEALHHRRQTRTKEGAKIEIAESIGQRLKKVSGHFSLFLVRKQQQTRGSKPGGFWAWNDPFGFLPVYHHRLGGNRNNNKNNINNNNNKYENATTILSSHWDCIVPAISPLQLDWDVVAEYLTLGTTLGGRRTSCSSSSSSSSSLDRTLVKHIGNLCPGTCLSIEAPDIASEVKNGLLPPPTITMKSYIDCYGACEEILLAKFLGKATTAAAEPDLPMGHYPSNDERMPKNNNSCIHHIRGVKLAETKKDKKNLMISPLPSSKGIETMDENIDNVDSSPAFSLTSVLDAIFATFLSCIEAALAQGHVGRAALTGGGDTRLILACLLLLLQEQHQQQQKDSKAKSTITFQTHSKQKTDWQIARHLATLFGLKHEKIRATSTTIEGAYDLASLFSREEVLLSNLHDQTPLRRKQNKKTEKHKDDILSYTLHGRFGTEFLGCLCFDKSPLDVRSHEIEELRPKATRWFRFMFVSAANDKSIRNDECRHLPRTKTTTTIRNPIDTLQERFDELEEDKTALEEKANNNDSMVAFDVSYAFQLQLYTRTCLCDIYKGLRGGSWFSIPSAQFTRNAITPFLDNTLLRLLLCLVSVRDKEEPYELYGKLYNNNSNSNSDIMDILLKVPSNNKLLCNHTSIPRAIKAPEAKARPFLPKQLRSTKKSPTAHLRKHVLEDLQHQFHPIFWKGAVAIFETAPVKMDATLVQEDPRKEVRAFVELVGNASDACLLSGRLQSFLLWHERRFLCHIPRRTKS